jgi:hypothetical protein
MKPANSGSGHYREKRRFSKEHKRELPFFSTYKEPGLPLLDRRQMKEFYG